MKRTIVMALLAVMVLAAFAEQSFISWWTGTGTDTLYTSHDDLVVGEDTLTADDHDTTAQGSQWPGWVVEEFPFNKWGLETYVDSIGGWPVPDTVFTELRWNYYSGGTYTSWVKYDTIVTLGASTAPVRSLVTVSFDSFMVKPYRIEARGIVNSDTTAVDSTASSWMSRLLAG